MTCKNLSKFGSMDYCLHMCGSCENCGCRTDGRNEDGVECVFFEPESEEDDDGDVDWINPTDPRGRLYRVN